MCVCVCVVMRYSNGKGWYDREKSFPKLFFINTSIYELKIFKTMTFFRRYTYPEISFDYFKTEF